MRTSKPIATISYNTVEYLEERLRELVKQHVISDWMFIQHHKEEDEKKDHIHLWVKPNRLVDTVTLQEFFSEYDPNNPDKPLKCIDFNSSKIDDWILYSMHFGPYLESKGEYRQYHYAIEDFHYHDEDTFEDNYHHAFKGSQWAKNEQVLQTIKRGDFDPLELIMSGQVPINLASSIRTIQMMMYDKMDKELKHHVIRHTISHTPIDGPISEENEDK